jgi:DNA-binding LytR/AlgR family response regulator
MTLQHFSLLGIREQEEKVLDEGVYLSSRLTETDTILFFQIDSFYVEVYYRNGKDEVSYIKSFETTDELDPYLERINISMLV